MSNLHSWGLNACIIKFLTGIFEILPVQWKLNSKLLCYIKHLCYAQFDLLDLDLVLLTHDWIWGRCIHQVMCSLNEHDTSQRCIYFMIFRQHMSTLDYRHYSDSVRPRKVDFSFPSHALTSFSFLCFNSLLRFSTTTTKVQISGKKKKKNIKIRAVHRKTNSRIYPFLCGTQFIIS